VDPYRAGVVAKMLERLLEERDRGGEAVLLIADLPEQPQCMAADGARPRRLFDLLRERP
jgi:hypothetical protein